MNTTQLLLATLVLVLLGGVVSVPGLLAYRSLLLRAPMSSDDQIKQLRQEVDDLTRKTEAQQMGMNTLQGEIRALTWDNAELRNALVRLAAQVVALGGKPVIEVDKLVH